MPNLLFVGIRRVFAKGIAVAVAALLGAALVPSAGAAPAPTSPMLCDTRPPYPMSEVRPGPYKTGSTDVVELKSDYDGEIIHLGLIRPNVPASQKVPVIVYASPYLDHNLSARDLTKCEPHLMEFVQHGYAIGLVAVRGTSDSGGCSDMMGNAERADLDQAITWFGKQRWSSGRVGMIGVSYDGSTPWEVASTGNKYLKTIVPISGVNDFFQLMYRNGAAEYRGPILSTLYAGYPFYPGDPTGRKPEHWVKSIACPAALKGLYASIHAFATGERDPLGYWAERNSRPGVEKNYKGSIFLARGLQDWNVDPSHDFPWVTELDRKGIFVKYMLGQWGHQWPDSSSEDEVMQPGEPVRWDWADILLDWWDYWLKNDKSVDLGPRAQVQDSSGKWRNEAGWPPPDATPVDYYLSADGSLSPNPSDEDGSFQIAYDAMKNINNNANRMCVCARFTLGRMKKDLRFAGIPEFSATVIPQGPGGHLAAWLYSSNGSQGELVGWGMVDLRFAQGGEKATAVIPGQELKVTVPIEPLDVVIPSLSSLVLVVAESGYGGNGTVPDRVSVSPFPMQLLVGGDKSKLTLPTFKASPKDFFTPPKEQ